MDKQILLEVGLSKNEIEIYLSLLKTGSQKATELSKNSKIPRTFVYELLDSLIDKGLVSHVIKSGIKYFEAVDPERLNTLLDEKKEALKSIMTNLKSMRVKTSEKPSINVYEGKEGIKTILEDILQMSKGETLFAYANADLFKKLEFFFPHFVTRRAKKQIKSKLIQEKEIKKLRPTKLNKKELREIRFFEKPLTSSVLIWQDKVAFLDLKGDILVGVLIKDKVIANTQLDVFEMLWKQSKA
jgi:sugar-specific transcriptional regulator TrmB